MLLWSITHVHADFPALQFDGIDDVVEISSPPKLGRTFTEEAWILPQPKDERYHGVLGSNPSKVENRPPGIWIKEFTVVHAGFGNGQHWMNVNSPKETLELDAWNHVASTYDGQIFRLYVNGNEVANLRTKDIPVDAPVSRIGRVNYWFPGAIREVRFWNRALSPQELRTQMTKSLSGGEKGLVAYFPLNDGSGDEARNLVDPSSRGRVQNGPQWINSTARLASALAVTEATTLKAEGIERFSPAGDNVAPDAPVEVELSKSIGPIAPGMVRLVIDGEVVVPELVTNETGQLTVRYKQSLREPGSSHTAELAVNGPKKTNNFSFRFSTTPLVLIQK